MNYFKPVIYTILTLIFLILSLEIVASDFNVTGFNKNILLAISSVMTCILFYASLALWKNRNRVVESEEVIVKQEFSVLRVGKVLFASYAVAFGVLLISEVFGVWIFAFEELGKIVSEYTPLILILVTVISIPVVNKYLR